MATIKELFDLDGKVAAITGGARDLGLDIGDVLAEAGCDLVISSRTLASAQKTAGELSERHGRDVLPLALNVADHAEDKQFIETAHEWKGHIDILVNNAGGSEGGGECHLFKRDPKDAVNLIEINLIGTLHCCQEASRHMADQGYGKIINIASIAGVMGRDRRMYERNRMKGQPIDYAAAKAGVIGMTMDLAGLLSPMGVRVNAISPGGFGPRQLSDGFDHDYSDRTPLGHMGRDGLDLKGAALFLAAPASDYVTGQNLIVDGGFSIWH